MSVHKPKEMLSPCSGDHLLQKLGSRATSVPWGLEIGAEDSHQHRSRACCRQRLMRVPGTIRQTFVQGLRPRCALNQPLYQLCPEQTKPSAVTVVRRFDPDHFDRQAGGPRSSGVALSVGASLMARS